MIRRTYGSVKAELARVCGTSGMSSNSSAVMDRVNEAIEELMNAGDWPGVVDRYAFNVTDGNIVLPYFLDRIMGISVADTPYPIRSPWFEFVEYGPGPQTEYGCFDAIVDHGESPTKKPIPADGDSWTLYTVGTVDERDDDLDRPTITVEGVGLTGRDVRTYVSSAWVDGEQIEINGDTAPYTTAGTSIFASVTAVHKPVTNGYVELWATNGDSADDVLLSDYAPEETNPSYHRYFLPTISAGTSTAILVRARKRYIPIREDNDELIISNLPALKFMLRAVQKRETEKWDEYAAAKLSAIQIMKEEAKAYRGTARTPALTIDRGFSLGEMPPLR